MSTRPEQQLPSWRDGFGLLQARSRPQPSLGLLSPELWRNSDIGSERRSAAAARRSNDVGEAASAAASDIEPQVSDPTALSADEMREEMARQIHRKENRWPLLTREPDRRKSILDNSVALFDIADNPDADEGTPWYSVDSNGYYGVAHHDARVRREAERLDVDPDLVRAIMYVEYANGFGYGGPAQAAELADSLYPMNIRPGLWQDLAGADADFNDSDINVQAGVLLLKRIKDRLTDPSIAKIATLYNSLAKDSVTDYGAQVAQTYKDKPWLRKPQTQFMGRNPPP